jgi:hypothetical protein
VIDELARWGAPFMAESPDGDDFRSHWLLTPIKLLLRDGASDRAPVTVDVRVEGEPPVVLEAGDGAVVARLGPADHPDARLTRSPEAVVGLLFGGITLSQARGGGLNYEGPPEILERLTGPPTPTIT